MTTELPDVPTWAKKALQGITYWIGHRRCLYNEYPLGESAFVAELCNLIYAHIETTQMLRCEVAYSELAGGADNLPTAVFGRRARADIVVARKPTRKDADPVPEFIIEVKRGSAPRREIDNDLKRLATIGALVPNCRTMLFVISEARRLDRFVTDKGVSVKGGHAIAESFTGHYRVRRTAKAVHALSIIEKAQYASLLEVYPYNFIKPKPKRATKKAS